MKYRAQHGQSEKKEQGENKNETNQAFKKVRIWKAFKSFDLYLNISQD